MQLATIRTPAKPYLLPISSIIEARIRAQNSVGFGEWSKSNKGQSIVRVYRVPIKVKALKAENENTGCSTCGPNDIKISWTPIIADVETGGQDVFAYQIFWDKGESARKGDNFVKYDETSTPACTDCEKAGQGANLKYSYIFKNLSKSNVYRFIVRARNSCNWGPFSEVKTADIRSTPEQMDPLTVKQGTCNVVISWNAPNNGGSTISKYTIRVADNKGKW